MIQKLIGVAAAVVMGALAGCAPGRRLAGGPAMAKSRGSVDFKRTPDRGTRIVLKVKNIAEPEDLDPPGYAYVAWVQSDREAPPHNVGALVVDADQRGLLKTSTTLRDFELFVTAEASSDVLQPTGPPLFWTHRDQTIKIVRHDEWSKLALGEE